MDNTSVMVSICCLTYNHAPYIRECLDGFLMQQVDFPIEIIIHDDASTVAHRIYSGNIRRNIPICSI